MAACCAYLHRGWYHSQNRGLACTSVDLNVEDHIRRRRLKAFLSRLALVRQLLQECLLAVMQHVCRRQVNSGMLAKAGTQHRQKCAKNRLPGLKHGQ